MTLTLDFAFEGFRLISKKPSLILSWGIFNLLFSIVAIGLMFLVSGSGFIAYGNMVTGATSGGVQPTPEAMMRIMSGLLPGYLAMIPIVFIGGVMIMNAVFRAVLQPKEGGFGYIKLGADEWRLIGVAIALFFVTLGVIAAIGVVAAVLFYLATLLPNGWIQGLAKTVVVFTAIFAYCVYGVRMSLTGPLVLDTKKFNLFGSLKLTKGNAWTLFFGHLIMIIVAFVSILVIEVVFYIVIMILIFAGMAMGGFDLGHPDNMQNVNWLVLVPVGLLIVLLYAALLFVITSLMYALMYGAPAAAYKILTTPKPGTSVQFEPVVEATPLSPDTL